MQYTSTEDYEGTCTKSSLFEVDRQVVSISKLRSLRIISVTVLCVSVTTDAENISTKKQTTQQF